MLSHEAFSSALPLATVLDGRRTLALPVSGTPLAKLVDATRSDEHFMSQSVDGFEPLIEEMEFIANAKDPILQVSPHDRVMDEITAVCIQAVQGHMQHARGVVAPAIQDMVERVTQATKALEPSSLLGMNVVVWNLPAPMQVSAFESLVRVLQETPYDLPRLAMRCPDITIKELVDFMSTGSSTTDAAIGEWVASKGDTFFLNLWATVFQIKQNEMNTSVSFRDFTECPRDGLDNAVAIFLIARKLVDAPMDGVDMSARQLEDLAADFRNQAGARICRGLDEYAEAQRVKQLIRSVEGKTIYVYADLYRSWIDAGGSNEVLFGNILDQPYAGLVEAIDAKAAALKQRWDSHAALTRLTESNRNFIRTKDILRQVFLTQLADIKEGPEASAAFQQTITGLFDQQLDNLTVGDMENVWTLSLQLLCRSRFYQSQAERILVGIERVKKENPNIDVREAAAASLIDYIAYWVSTQIRFEVL